MLTKTDFDDIIGGVDDTKQPEQVDATLTDPKTDVPAKQTGITSDDLDAILFSSKPVDKLSSASSIDPDEFSAYMDGVDEEVGDIFERRAQNQKGFEVLGNFGKQLGAEVIGGAIEGSGYLLNLPKFISNFEDTEKSFGEDLSNAIAEFAQEGNTISEFGSAFKRNVNSNNPIFQTKKTQEGLGRISNLINPEWWASNGASIGSALSLLIPGAAAAKGVSSAVGKLGSILKGGKAVSQTTRTASATIGGAFANRHMESAMEATQVYEQKLAELQNRGIGSDEATAIASKAAANTYKWNYANMLLDLGQYNMLFRKVNFANLKLENDLRNLNFTNSNSMLSKLAGKAKSQQGLRTTDFLEAGGSKLDVLKAMASEGFEEAVQFGISAEASHFADVAADISTGDSVFGTRLRDYLKDPELWNSAFFGAIGGGLFKTGGEFLAKRGFKNSTELEKARLQNHTDRIKSARSILADAANASLEGDEVKYNQLINKVIGNIGIKAAERGEIGLEKSFFETVSGLDTEILEGEGFTEEARSASIDAAAKLKQVEALYNNYADRNYDVTEEQAPFVKELASTLTSMEWGNLTDLQSISDIDKLLATSPEDQSLLDRRAKLEENIEKRSDQINSLINDSDTRNKFFKDAKKEIAVQIDKIRKQQTVAEDEKNQEAIQEEVKRTDAEIAEESAVEDNNFAETFSEKEVSFDELSPEEQEIARQHGLAPEETKKEQAKTVQEPKETTQEAPTTAQEDVKIPEDIANATQEEFEALLFGSVDLDNQFADDIPDTDVLVAEANRNVQQVDEVTASEVNDPLDAVFDTNQPSQAETPKSKPTKPKKKKTKTIQPIEENAVQAATKANTQTFESVSDIPPVNDQDFDFRASLEALEEGNIPANRVGYRSASNNHRLKDLSPVVEWAETHDVEGQEIEFSVNFPFLESSKISKAAKKAVLDGNRIIREGDKYFFDGKKKILVDPGKLPLRLSPLDSNGTPIEINGQVVYGSVRDFSNQKELTKDELEAFRAIKANIYNATLTSSAKSTIVDRSSGRLLKDFHNPDGDPDKATKTNVGELLTQIGQDSAPLAITDGTGSVTDRSGDTEHLAPSHNFKSSGSVFVILDDLAGGRKPHKLNTRKLSKQEASLIYDIYSKLIDPKIPFTFDTVLDEPRVSGITVKGLLDLLTYETLNDASDQFIGTVNENRRLKVKGSVVNFGPHRADPSAFAREEIKNLFINYLTENMLHHVHIKNLGDGDRFHTIIGETDKFSLFGKEYDTNALSSYREFLLDGDEPVLTSDIPLEHEGSFESQTEPIPIKTPFISPVIKWDATPFTGEQPVPIDNDVEATIKSEISTSKNTDAINIEELYRLADFKVNDINIIDVEAERDWIKSRLPSSISVRVIDDLIKVKNRIGGEAFGAFSEGMITLSRTGATGTGYHEAFHAVLRTFLTPKQIESVFADARTVYDDPNITDLQLEEALAEDFREFVSSDGQIKFGTKKTGGLFKRLWEMIKSIFTSRTTVNELFQNISDGKFKNSIPIDTTTAKFTGKTAFSRIGPFSDIQISEITETLAFLSINLTPNLFDSGKMDLSKLTKGSISDVLRRVAQGEINAGRNENAATFAAIDAHLDSFMLELDGWFSQFGIVRTGDTEANLKALDGIDESSEIDVEEITNHLNIRPRYEFSAASSGSHFAKMFVALQPDVESFDGDKPVYKRSNFLGLPKMADFGKTWSKIAKITSNKPPAYFNGVYHSSWDQMKAALEEAGKTDVNIRNILRKLEQPNISEESRKSIHAAFLLADMNFSSMTWNSTDSGIEVRIFGSQAAKAARRIQDQWDNNFVNSVIFSDPKSSIIGLGKRLHALDEKVKAQENPKVSDAEELVDILNTFGIEIDVDSIIQYIRTNGSNRKVGMNKLIRKLKQGFFKKGLKPILDGSVTKDDIQKGTSSPVANETIINDLAQAFVEVHTEFQDVETTIFAAGKTFYTKSRPNHLIDTINSIKNGSDLLSDLKKTVFGQHSYWLGLMENDSKLIESLGYQTLNTFGEKGRNAEQWKTIEDFDSMVGRANLILNKKFPTLNMSDKSTFNTISFNHLVKGINKTDSTKPTLITDKAASIFTEYALAEHARIRKVYQHLHGESPIAEEDRIKNLHGSRGLQFSENFVDLNHGSEFLQNHPKLQQLLWASEDVPRATHSLELRQELKKAISEILLNVVQEELGIYENLGLIERNEKGLYSESKSGKKSIPFIEKGIRNGYISNSTNTSEALIRVIGDVAINGMIANIEQMGLFHGDLGIYKAADGDLTKRTSGAVAFGEGLLVDGKDVPHKYKVAVLQDVETDYQKQFFDIYLEILGDRDLAEKLTLPYKKTNEGDAQGYITLDRYRSIRVGQGRWSKTKQEAWIQIKSGNVTKEHIKNLELTPIKGVYFGRENIDGIEVRNYHKYSSMPLIPALVKDTELGLLLQKMNDQEVSEAIFESGVKLGARGLNRLGDDAPLNSYEVSNDNWRLQVETPTKGMKPILLGSQQGKLISSDIEDVSELIVDGEKLTGKEVKNEISKIYAELSNRDSTKLLKDLNVDPETLTTNNAGALSTLLKKELIKRDAPQEAIKYLDLDSNGNFKIPLSMTPYATQFQNIFFSMIKDAGVRNKSLGGSFVQASSVGLKSFDLTGETLANNQELKPPRFENGIWKPGQVLVPSWFKSKIPGADKLTVDELNDLIKKNPEAFRMVVYRIPTQSKASMAMVEVAGFLPDSVGDTMVLYPQITAQMGSDFDIDKINFMLPNIDPKSEELALIKDDSDQGLHNRLLRLYEGIFASKDGFVDSTTSIDAISLKPIANELRIPSDNINKLSLSFMLPSSQTRLNRTFADGGAQIGIVVNALTNHVLSQNAAISFAEGLGITESKGSESLSLIVNENGDKISLTLSAMANASVDVAKDPYLATLNVNTFTANAILLMIRAGADPRKVFAFAKQPIITEFVKETRRQRSKMVPNTRDRKPYDVIREKWLERGEKQLDTVTIGEDRDPRNLLASKTLFGISSLKNDIKKQNELVDDPYFTYRQIQLLDEFNDVIMQGKDLAGAVRATKADTVGATKDLAGALAIRNNADVYFAGDTNILGFDNLFTNTALGAKHKNTIGVTTDRDANIVKNYFVEGTKAFNSVVDQIGILFGKAHGLTDSEIIRTVHEEAKAYLLSESPLNPSFEQKQAMLFGKNTMAKRLRKMKKAGLKNELIDHLNYRINSAGPSWVMSNSNKKSGYQANRLINAWKELLNDPKTKPFAVDLAKYAYMTSGMRGGLFTFHQLIPMEVQEELGMPQFYGELNQERTRLGNPDYLQSFVDQLFRANVDDNKLVPTINVTRNSFKKESKVGQYVTLVPTKIEHLVVGKTPEKTKVHVPYIKTKEQQLYKLVGYRVNDKGRAPVYQRISKLGFNKSGMKIYEYNFDRRDRIGSQIKTNNVPRSTIPFDIQPYTPPTISISSPLFEERTDSNGAENMDNRLENKICQK